MRITGAFSSLQSLTVSQFVATLIQLLLMISVVLFFFSLMIGGIQLMISGGEKTRTEAAKNRIISTFVGLVIVFSAWAVIALFGNLFGVNLVNLSIPHI